jgi:hypothetical protein
VQGREKALEGDSPDEMLRKFAAFPQIQVIDLDAAMGRGANDDLVEMLASKAVIARAAASAPWNARAGAARAGRVPRHRRHLGLQCRWPQPRLPRIACRCHRPRPHRARARFEGRPHRHQRLAGSHPLHRRRSDPQLEPYCSGFLCTYVDKEGMMQGTDLDWFRRLRAATDLEITAAGGITTMDDIRALDAMHIHCAVGMAIYTGRLDLVFRTDGLISAFFAFEYFI